MYLGVEPFHLTALRLALLVGLYMPTVISYSHGAPKCDDLTPHHRTTAQTSEPQYSVDFSPKYFEPGDTITVTISGKSGETFKGFAIAARLDGSDDNYGNFTAVADTHTVPNCSEPNSVLTHSNKTEKSSLSFNWTSPMDIPPGLYFKSTFVKSYTTFWTNLKTPLTSRTTGMPATTSSSVTRKTSNTWKCSEDFECQISWEMDTASKTTNFEFRLQVTDPRSYLALGLSEDSHMGSDSVMECLYLDGKVKGQYSYNEGMRNIKVADLTLNSGRYVDGSMICNFTRDNVIDNSKIFNIGQKHWILLAATGPVQDGFVKRKHTFATATKSKVDFTTQQRVDSEEATNLVHLHGVFMIIAWVFFGSVGIFAARYSKSVNRKLCKIMLWFQTHRTFMMLAMLFTIAGFVVIFVHNDGEYSDLHGTSSKAHPIIGIIVTVFVIVNPIIAYFRPGKDHPRRIYFYWVHSMIGTVLIILADVAVFIGVLMYSRMEGTDKMYKAFVIEMSLFVIYKFLAGFGMEILQCCEKDGGKAEDEQSVKETLWSRLTGKIAYDKVTSYEMSTPGQNKPPEPEVKEGNLKAILLMIHTVICLIFTTSLVCTLYMET